MSRNAKTIVISNIATTPRASLELTVRVAISKVKGESL